MIRAVLALAAFYLADQLKHLVDTFAIETGHTRAQLSDIKDELRSVRGVSQRPRARAVK